MSRITQQKIQQRLPLYVPNMKVNPDAPISLSVCFCVLDKTLDLSHLQPQFKKSFVVYVGEGTLPNENSISLPSVGISRNVYLSFVVTNKKYFDLMIVLDNTNLEEGGFSCCNPNRLETWDAVFANQTYKYYDINNLRPKPNVTNREIQKHIPKSSEPIQVVSAFGGLAIYKTKFLSENMYANDEHVTFNTRYGGQRKFVYPSLLLKTSPEMATFYVV
uniref:Uncharacterized protein n=1 Tax=viral metagenome TaxID=1070528 RepID=A0A6C0I662_9ZZZZ